MHMRLTSNNENRNRQLQSLHNRIIGLNEQYNDRHKEWLKVKYQLMQSIHSHTNNNTIIRGENNMINNNSRQQQLNKQYLKQAIKIQQIQSDKIDNQFKTIFNQQYVEKLLTTQKQQLSTTQRQLIHKQQQRQLSYSNSSDGLEQQQQIKLSVIRQKHQNQLLQKEIQFLIKQFTTLQLHYGLNNNNKQQPQLQQQQQLTNSNFCLQQQHQRSIPSSQSIPLVQNEQDRQLRQQISCISKLINNKLSLINQLSSTNQQIQSNISQLKAKQSLLEKKKSLLQNKQLVLEKKVNQLIICKKNQLSLKNSDDKNQNNQRNVNIKSVIQQVKQINTLINQQLYKRQHQQKLSQIKNKFNSNTIQSI